MNVNIRTQINVVESIGSIRCQDQRFQDDGENLFSVRHFFWSVLLHEIQLTI